MATLSTVPSTTPPTVGGELKKLREARGLSLRKLARLAAVNVSSLSRWEAGRRTPALPELDAVFTALEASDTQKRALLRLMDAPRAIVRLRAMDSTGTAMIASGGGGDLLWAMRKRKGWTQAETARAAGVAQAQIAWWEHGDAWPNAQNLHALCWALGARPEEVGALTQRADSGGRYLLAQDHGDDWDNWSEHQWVDYLRVLLNQSQPEALADLTFIGVEQRLALRASQHPFAAALLPDVYAIHARHYLYRNEQELARHWAERGYSFLRQRRSWTRHSISHQPLWFGNVLILSSQLGQKRRPAGLRRGVKILRDWLPALQENTAAGNAGYTGNAGSALMRESASAHDAWGQMTLATTLAMLGQKDEAVRLGKEVCLRAELLRPSESFMRWRDYSVLLRRVSQPAQALEALIQSRAQVVWEKASPDTVARHTLMEAQCFIALDDTPGAGEKAREAEQLIAGHNLWHLRNELQRVTSSL